MIPVYNGSNYLRQAAESALEQTYPNIEVIVVNDGSDDNGQTEEVAKSYGEKIRYFHKPNGGVASALNYGIRKMAGDYFSWLSHDDVYLPHKIETQVNYLRATGQENIILYSDYNKIDHEGRFLETVSISELESSTFRFNLIYKPVLHGCTLLIPKSVFGIVGYFNEELKTTQDYELWFRIAKCFEFRHLNEPLIESRVHAEQGSRTILSHSVERDNYIVSSLKDLSVEELSLQFGKNSAAYSCLRMAILCKQKGLASYRPCLRLAKEYLEFDSFPAYWVNYLLMLHCQIFVGRKRKAFAKKLRGVFSCYRWRRYFQNATTEAS